MALFVITILALITVALTDLEQSSGVSFSLDVNSMRAFYAAESGAQVAMNRIFPPDTGGGSCVSPTVTFTAKGLNGCRASIACSVVTVDSISYYTLRSTGACGSGLDLAERLIEVRARQ